jgi:site-specific DNA-methyltransferase (adenine-specific)
MNKALLSSKKMDWCTPNDFFTKLNNEFHFTLDAAASKANAKCDSFYTQEDDALSKDWEGETVFVNPPYGREIGDWVKKAYEESRKPNTVVVMLIPARTDTKYFHEYIIGKSDIRFLKGRLKFEYEDGSGAWAAPFPSMVVIFKSGSGNSITAA